MTPAELLLLQAAMGGPTDDIDPYIGYVQALVQPAATDTLPLDYSGKGGGALVSVGNNGFVTRSTAWKKYGSYSMLFPTVSSGYLLWGPGYTGYLDFGANDFTVGFTVRFNEITGAMQTVIINGPAGSGGYQNGWAFSFAADLKSVNFSAGVSNGSNSIVTAAVNYTFAINTDYSVELNRRGNVLYWFVNGGSAGTSAFPGTIIPTAATGYGGPYGGMGGFDDSNNGTPGRYWLHGYVDGLYVVKGRALHTASYDIAAFVPKNFAGCVLFLSAETAIADDPTGRGKQLALSSGFSLSTAGVFPGYGAMPFDGGTTALMVPITSMGTANFVAEAIVRCNNYTGAAARPIMDLRTSDAAGIDLYIASNGLLYVSKDGVVLGSSTATFPLNIDVHVAIVRSANVISVYLGGVRYLTFAYSAAINSPNLRVGYGANGYFLGSIYSVRLTVGTDRGMAGTSIATPGAAWMTAEAA